MFLSAILAISLLIISLWNIQSELPKSNISEYFPNEITKIYDRNYDLLYHVGTKDRFYLDYNQIPKTMIDAIISAEDKNFFEHNGFDLSGIIRAIYVNINNILFKDNKQYVGASTITQQLVKNILLTNEKTLIRKLKEVILSIRIEKEYSKEYILELYLNEIYFGRRSYGIATAASNYFNKSIYDLTLEQYAYLAALPKGPNNYDPNKNYKKAKNRRDYVLKQMQINNFISNLDLQNNLSKPVEISNYNIKKYYKSYDTDFIIKDIKKLSIDEDRAYYVQSTINPYLQNLSEKSLLDSLALFEKKYRDWNGSFKHPITDRYYLKHWKEAQIISKDSSSIKFIVEGEIKKLTIKDNLYGPNKISPLLYLNKNDYFYVTEDNNKFIVVQPPKINGAMVVLNPFNGNILSLVGGVNYGESSFNRATQAYRQPGSSIKPFIYALGLSSEKFSPNSIILDSQVSLSQGPNLPIWEPKNYSNKSYGKISYRKALETSNNLVTLKIGLDLGLDKINNFFNKIELYKNSNKEIYSLLLGSIEQNLLDLVKNYSIFVNGGYKIQPNIIKKIVTDDGYSIDKSFFMDCKYCEFESNSRSYREPIINNNRTRAIDEFTAFHILNILEGAVKRGTGKSLNKINYPIAGKTGTTNDSKDLWFFGLMPEMIVGVYVGYDKPRTIGYKETGSSVALPVFKKFITKYIESSHSNLDSKFNIPQGLISKHVDIESGVIYDNLHQNTNKEFFTSKQINKMKNTNIQGIN